MEEYLEQAEQDRQDMVDNLETQGISGLSGNETFTQLVPQILNIQSGGDYVEQYSTMPTATAEDVGKIVQFTGTTDSTYTNGYFYKCTSTTEENETTYSWKQENVQPAPSMSAYELTSNKVSSITSSSTNTEYAGAKAVWDLLKSSNLKIDRLPNCSTYPNRLIFNNIDLGLYLAAETGTKYIEDKTITDSGTTGFNVLFMLYFKKYADATKEEVFAYLYGINRKNDSTTLGNGAYACLALKKDTNGIYQPWNLSYSYSGNDYKFLTNQAQTFSGVKTFSSFPITPSSAPTTNYQTANKKYVDDSISNAIGSINTILATLTTPQGGNE